MKIQHGWSLILSLCCGSLLLFTGCQAPQKAEPARPAQIADGEIDPAEWGKAYPVNYDMWKQTAEPTEAGKSKYKRGFDADGITYDKLQERPLAGRGLLC